ncbi:MAG: HPr kinase/phosphorylase [Rickettsiales bacterium]
MTLSLHATAIAYRGAGLLMLGPSGSGKSQLAAHMLLHGAHLVADDRVNLTVESGLLIAHPVPGYETLLELRHLGIIRAPECAAFHPLHLVAELVAAAPERLPEPQTRDFMGIALPLVRLHPTVPCASLLLYLEALRDHRLLPTDWQPVKTD